METAIQLTTQEKLSLFETTRSDRKQFVSDIIDALNEGITSPLEIHLQVKAMEDIINQLTNTDERKNKNFTAAIRYRQLLLEAAEKYGAKSFDFHSSKVEIKEVGTVYDYSKCNDPEVIRLQEILEVDKKLLEERQKFLKSVPPSGIDIRVNDELVTVYPPSKKSTTSVSVTLK